MGRRPGSWDPPAWGGPWKGLLLAASVLGSCLQPAPAQTQTPVTIVLSPPSPAVGGGVSLAPQNLPQDMLLCSWYRSATAAEPSRILNYLPGATTPQQNGPAHTGRETAGPGCVLHIAGLTLNNTGSYTVQIQSPTSPGLATVHLRVYASAADSSGGLSPGAIAGIVIGSLAAAALIGGLVYFLLCRTGGETKQHSPVEGQAAPAQNQGVSGSKPTLGEEDIQYSTLAFSAGDQKPPPGPQTPREGGTVYSEIRKK